MLIRKKIKMVRKKDKIEVMTTFEKIEGMTTSEVSWIIS